MVSDLTSFISNLTFLWGKSFIIVHYHKVNLVDERYDLIICSCSTAMAAREIIIHSRECGETISVKFLTLLVSLRTVLEFS